MRSSSFRWSSIEVVFRLEVCEGFKVYFFGNLNNLSLSHILNYSVLFQNSFPFFHTSLDLKEEKMLKFAPKNHQNIVFLQLFLLNALKP